MRRGWLEVFGTLVLETFESSMVLGSVSSRRFYDSVMVATRRMFDSGAFGCGDVDSVSYQ